jgi:transcription initiation factor TFIIIB Brf1 subunit/transcription initiation factor TFIIB
MWNYLDIKVTKGGKISERTELAVAGKIEVISNKLNLAPMLKNTAVVEGKQLLKYLRETHCVRLTCEEVAVIAIWVATRKELFPLSMRELADAAGWEKNEVYPLLNRVAKYFSLPKKRIPEFIQVRHAYNHIAARTGIPFPIIGKTIRKIEAYPPHLIYSPSVAAAFFAYYYSNHYGFRLFKKKVCMIAGVDEASICHFYNRTINYFTDLTLKTLSISTPQKSYSKKRRTQRTLLVDEIIQSVMNIARQKKVKVTREQIAQALPEKLKELMPL